MKISNIMNIGIIAIVILIILSSGCASSSTTKTFSDGVMRFNYPGDFENVIYSENTNSNSPMRVIAKFENNIPLKDQEITVGKNISSISATEVRDRSVTKVKNMSTGEILSISTETNHNGIIVEKITYTYELVLGIRTIYNDMYFKINDSVYAISVDGPDTTIGT